MKASLTDSAEAAAAGIDSQAGEAGSESMRRSVGAIYRRGAIRRRLQMESATGKRNIIMFGLSRCVVHGVTSVSATLSLTPSGCCDHLKSSAVDHGF